MIKNDKDHSDLCAVTMVPVDLSRKGRAMNRIALSIVVTSLLLCYSSDCLSNDLPEKPLTETETKAITPFTAVVQRNWKSWSQGSETVNKVNLIARMASAEYRGEDAAALVALEMYLKKNPSVDLATASALDDSRIIDRYHRDVVKLRRAKRVLFANGKPTFELLQQGPAGDCYFFSATGWMAKNRPGDVMKAIRQLDDGRFQVRFANGDEATVTAPTDAELAVNDSDSTLQDGLWMSVLEKATGTIQSRNYSRSAAIPDPTVAIDTAGIPIASVVERWSGREARKLPLGRQAHRAQVRSALIRMQEKQLLATALLLHRPPAKLAYDHVYAIMGFDAAADIVTIWNPWGTDLTLNGPSGPENGYERKKGIFTLSFDEFVTFYTFLAMEQK